jgi:adenylate kinase family enzyme
MNHRIHIFGAAGSGTTTLGSILSRRSGIPHFDTDEYFWVKTTVPYTLKREIPERTELLKSDLLKSEQWVLSGSLCGWGDFAIPLFTLVVFLWIPSELRMKRLKDREILRYGVDAISPGGWFHRNHLEFMEWASAYDSANSTTRSWEAHEQWMSKLPCKLLRIEGDFPPEELAIKVEHELAHP